MFELLPCVNPSQKAGTDSGCSSEEEAISVLSLSFLDALCTQLLKPLPRTGEGGGQRKEMKFLCRWKSTVYSERAECCGLLS